MRRNRTSRVARLLLVLAAGLIAAPTSMVLGTPAAQAQNLGQRVVSGRVVDPNAASVVGATVFLRSLKTKAIRSYTTASDGRFRFAQVNMVEDFELWADKDGKKTPVKTVSTWDSRKEFETELKMK